VLGEKEKQELREMGASESLCEDFRVMRRNSEALAARLNVIELARWLTSINRVCPMDPISRRPIRDSDMRL
jgi:hypothetical protein